ncbi:MAG: type II toxin-antitoxin system VapC family toxin [Myxococcota bacterium]
MIGKVVIDTNVFVDYLRAGHFEQWVWGGMPGLVRFAPAIALLELRLGAHTELAKDSVAKIERGFSGRRLVAPPPGAYSVAGQVFREVYAVGSEPSDRFSVINDVLIALTARDLGAAVLTSNIGEFRRLAAAIPGLRVVSPADA